jgi:tetratricopeptide (TPR) repeat protein
MSNIGLIYYNLGKVQQALEFSEKAVTIYQKKGNKSIGLAMAFNNIGAMLLYQGQHN